MNASLVAVELANCGVAAVTPHGLSTSLEAVSAGLPEPHPLRNASYLHIMIMSSIFCGQEESLSQIAVLSVCVSSSLAPGFHPLRQSIDGLVEVFRVESECLLSLENLQW